MRMGRLYAAVGIVYNLFDEVSRMTVKYALLYILMLPVGITLTAITLFRMRAGKILLPQWAKSLVVLGMIFSQIVLLAAMLPTKAYQAIADTLVPVYTQSATPIDPSASELTDPTS